MKVLVVRSYLSDWIAKQKDLLPENVELITPEKGTEEELVKLARDVEVIVCTRLSAAVIKNAKNLKLIQKTGAGVDAIPFDVISTDTYLYHIAGLLDIPFLAIFTGGINPDARVTYYDKKVVIEYAEKCYILRYSFYSCNKSIGLHHIQV